MRRKNSLQGELNCMTGKEKNNGRAYDSIGSQNASEKEVEISVEDILMYSLERRFPFVITECFKRINKSNLSLNCQLRLVMCEQMNLKDSFYCTNNVKVDQHLAKVCNLLRALQFLMSNANVEDVREESFVASFMLKRWICVCHLYHPSEHGYLSKFLQLYFREMTENHFKMWISNERFATQHRTEILKFAASIEKLAKSEKTASEYFECKVYEEFDEIFWETLKYLVDKVVHHVKSNLPKSILEQILNVDVDKVEVGDGDEKQRQILSYVFQEKKMTEERVIALLNAIPKHQQPPLVPEATRGSQLPGCSEDENNNFDPLATADPTVRLPQVGARESSVVEPAWKMEASHLNDVTNYITDYELSPMKAARYDDDGDVCDDDVMEARPPRFLAQDDESSAADVKEVCEYYSRVLPDDEDHVCGTDDESETELGDHIDYMYLPNFHKFLTDD